MVNLLAVQGLNMLMLVPMPRYKEENCTEFYLDLGLNSRIHPFETDIPAVSQPSDLFFPLDVCMLQVLLWMNSFVVVFFSSMLD